MPVSYGSRVYPKDDEIFYGIRLDPPISIEHGRKSTLKLHYSGKDPFGTGSIYVQLYKDIAHRETYIFGGVSYDPFDTHYVRMNKDGMIDEIGVCVQNAQKIFT